LRVLYTGSDNIALIGGIGSVGNVRVKVNGGAKENISNAYINRNTGRQCWGGIINKT